MPKKKKAEPILVAKPEPTFADDNELRMLWNKIVKIPKPPPPGQMSHQPPPASPMSARGNPGVLATSFTVRSSEAPLSHSGSIRHEPRPPIGANLNSVHSAVRLNDLERVVREKRSEHAELQDHAAAVEASIDHERETLAEQRSALVAAIKVNEEALQAETMQYEKEMEEQLAAFNEAMSEQQGIVEVLEADRPRFTEILRTKHDTKAELERLKDLIVDLTKQHKEEEHRTQLSDRDEIANLKEILANKFHKTKEEMAKKTGSDRNVRRQRTSMENMRLARELATYEREVKDMQGKNQNLMTSVERINRSIEMETEHKGILQAKHDRLAKHIEALVGNLRRVEGQFNNSAGIAKGQESVRAMASTVDKQYELILDLKFKIDTARKRVVAEETRLQTVQRARFEEVKAFAARRAAVEAVEKVKKAMLVVSPTARTLSDVSSEDRARVVNTLIRAINVQETGLLPMAAPMDSVARPTPPLIASTPGGASCVAGLPAGGGTTTPRGKHFRGSATSSRHEGPAAVLAQSSSTGTPTSSRGAHTPRSAAT